MEGDIAELVDALVLDARQKALDEGL